MRSIATNCIPVENCELLIIEALVKIIKMFLLVQARFITEVTPLQVVHQGGMTLQGMR